jgi:hypothetical protein
MTHHTTDHLTIISRLGELYFEGDKKLQREFYEYLTQYPPRIHNVPCPLIDLLNRFAHADDAQPIENPTEELRKLLEESGKVLEAPLHRPDSVLARSEYRKVENLPDFLANLTNDKNDYYYDIDERILEIPSKTDKHEQELHKHMKEMGEAYRKLLSQIGIQIP